MRLMDRSQTPHKKAKVLRPGARRPAKDLCYARFSIDSHFTRNYLYVKRNHPEKLAAHVPEYAERIVGQYTLPD